MNRKNIETANLIEAKIKFIENMEEGNTQLRGIALDEIRLKFGDGRHIVARSLLDLCSNSGMDYKQFEHLEKLVQLQISQALKDQKDMLIDDLQALD